MEWVVLRAVETSNKIWHGLSFNCASMNSERIGSENNPSKFLVNDRHCHAKTVIPYSLDVLQRISQIGPEVLEET